MTNKKKDSIEELYDEKYEEPEPEDFLEEEAESPKKRKKKKGKRAGVRIAAIGIAMLLVFQSSYLLFDGFRLDSLRLLHESNTIFQNEEVESWKDSIVTVQGQADGQEKRGTGFALQEDGYLLTNQHVVEGVDQIGVYSEDGEWREASLIAADAEKDLALLEIEEGSIPGLSIKESAAGSGEEIYVIGNPLRLTWIASRGEIITPGSEPDERMIISASVFNGSSGSPVINETGEVEGIVFARGTEESGEAVGIAVEAETINGFLEENGL